MTPPSSAAQTPNVQAPNAGAAGLAQARSRFGGFGGGLLGGLLAGGLIGGLMGHGWGGGGGGGGFMSILFQLALIAGGVWLAMRFFRRRDPTAVPANVSAPSFLGGAPQGGGGYPPAAPPTSDGFYVGQPDQETFQRLLYEVQDAFGREDYGRLRERTTPEVMSYLAEELSQNATQGRRNDVSKTRLISAEISESWREGNTDFVTTAFKYESVDIMRDRTTGAVVSGDPVNPTAVTELWTFVRVNSGPWLVSAIQETAPT